MSEIAAVRGSRGLTLISTFSGCGGSCLGFEMAGYSIRAACEFVAAARETYTANHPEVPIDPRDIREVSGADLLRIAGLTEVDVLEGSPPCAPFSTAGKRAEKWGRASSYSDTHQRSDDLFFEFSRLVGEIRPRAFVAENVSGLVKGVAKGYFKQILAELKSNGYRVAARLLDASWLGVPQARQRVIFIGIRDDLDRSPVFPEPFPYQYTVADACPWLSIAAQWGGNGSFQSPEPREFTHRPSPTILGSRETSQQFAVSEQIGNSHPETEDPVDSERRPASAPFDTKKLIAARRRSGAITALSLDAPHPTVTTVPHDTGIERGASGHPDTDDPVESEIIMVPPAMAAKWRTLRLGESHEKNFSLVRSHPDRPAPTIQASHGQPGIYQTMPPFAPRKFTILELKRICSFPDDFRLTGSFPQRWERLGRAVPPLMMKAVADGLARTLLA